MATEIERASAYTDPDCGGASPVRRAKRAVRKSEKRARVAQCGDFREIAAERIQPLGNLGDSAIHGGRIGLFFAAIRRECGKSDAADRVFYHAAGYQCAHVASV